MSKHKKPDPCPYNQNVECRISKSDCRICGWNPTVDEKRREEFKQYHQDNDRKENYEKITF